jgi:hypothetical protein
VRTINYTAALEAKEASFGERLVAWLLKQSAGTAHAKRWFAVSALSPDGRWLVVDGGMDPSLGVDRSLFVIDTQTLQAAQWIELSAAPTVLTFDSQGLLYVFLEKRTTAGFNDVLAIDLASGAQTELTIKMSSSVYELFATR